MEGHASKNGNYNRSETQFHGLAITKKLVNKGNNIKSHETRQEIQKLPYLFGVI